MSITLKVNTMTIVSAIYIILNTRNNKIYIGQTQDIRRRWAKHRSELNLNKHPNRHLQAAWNKYGAKAFRFKILERCAVDQLDEREQHFLNIYMVKENCYNRSSEAGTVRGIKRSPESRKRLSEALKGHKISDETRAKIGASNKGKSKGVKRDKKLVDANAERSRKDWILTDPDGLEYRVHGLTEFCLEHGLNANAFSRVAGGKWPHHKGWKCRRLD
jgi:group I intron endonuclease